MKIFYEMEPLICSGSSIKRLWFYSEIVQWMHTMCKTVLCRTLEMLVLHAVCRQTSSRREPNTLFLSKILKKFLHKSFFFNICAQCILRLSAIFIFDKRSFPFHVLDLLYSSLTLFLVFWNIFCLTSLHISYFSILLVKLLLLDSCK